MVHCAQFVVLSLLVLCVACVEIEDGFSLDQPALNPAIIEEVNKQTKLWTAGINDNFRGETEYSIQRLLGWEPNPYLRASLPTVYDVVNALPTSFDSRQAWANCTSIGSIQNQAECGSCWAFGAVEAITDRWCIHKGEKVQLSFQDMVSCDRTSNGCNGGSAESAWRYAENPGLVSEACYPYEIPTCPPSQQPCTKFVPTPKCATQCVSNSSKIWSQDLHKLSRVNAVASNVDAIRTELMTNGPVEACFDVYADFVTYKTGVYHHVSGGLLGGHCIKVIGWGTDAATNTDYWLCANSWTPTWGDQGFFKIRRGTDECGIERGVVAGLP